jgi:hypothetical protein
MDLSSLNFQPGAGVQATIRARYGEPTNHFPVHGLKEFFLIVSVGRCKFKLSEQTIGFLLQATIGGTAVDFRPQQLSDRVFKFVVASCNVGFHIYNLISFSCEEYHIFFNLSNNGGAHWQSESKKYFKEEENQWTYTVKPNGAHFIRGRKPLSETKLLIPNLSGPPRATPLPPIEGMC